MPAVVPFDLPLVNLASAVCEDEEFASEAYATAMKVAKGVLDAELALMVERIPAVGGDAQEPATLALQQEGLLLLRLRLLLELHALVRRDLPWQQKRALLRALQNMGLSSLVALGEIRNTTAIVEAFVKVAGMGDGGWAAHHRGPIKNGSPLLHAGEALVAHSFSQRYSAAAEAVAAAGPEAPAAALPALRFKERLAVAGYAAIHRSARPSREMVDLVVTKAKSAKRICPFLDSRQHPWRDNTWTKGKTGKATVALGAEFAEAAGGGVALSKDVIARAAVVESAKVMSERELAGTWLASVTGVAHSLAVVGCLGDGGLAVASGYLVVITTVLAKRGPLVAILYDEKLCRLACDTEDMTVEDVLKLFHEKNPSVVSEVVLTLELPNKFRRTARQQQRNLGRQLTTIGNLRTFVLGNCPLPPRVVVPRGR